MKRDESVPQVFAGEVPQGADTLAKWITQHTPDVDSALVGGYVKALLAADIHHRGSSQACGEGQ